MTARLIAAATALSLAALPALAGMQAPDAQMHFKAIASASVPDIMSQYVPGATLHWVGGPLDGTYSGTDAIKAVWSKFAKAMGKETETASNITVAGDAAGMTVTADVNFKGRKAVDVRYVLVYRGNRIVDEIWQIDSKMGNM